MAFGFLLWTAGTVLTLPLLSGGRVPAGTAAIGVFLSLVIWGTTVVGLFPYVHRPLHASTDRPGALTQAGLGPNAARSDEHTSELQSLICTSYHVFCLTKNKNKSN